MSKAGLSQNRAALAASARPFSALPKTGLAASDETVLVLAVPDADTALAVTHASQAGKVTVVRSTGAHGFDESSYQPPEG